LRPRLVRDLPPHSTPLFDAARYRPDASAGNVASTARQVRLIAERLWIPRDQCDRLLGLGESESIFSRCMVKESVEPTKTPADPVYRGLREVLRWRPKRA
jgi:hypothetical protein